MKAACGIVAVGRVDARGLRGSGGVDRTWASLDVAPPGDARTWRALFGGAFRTFRRLDLLSQTLLLAAEAAGVGEDLGDDERLDTAVVIGSRTGSLDADLRFAGSLAPGREPEAARFPYTLPSAAVGELALRHGLRGPSLFLSIEDDPWTPLDEARRRVEEGDACAAVAAYVDALGEDVAPQSADAVLVATVALLRAEATPIEGASWDELARSSDPWTALANL